MQLAASLGKIHCVGQGILAPEITCECSNICIWGRALLYSPDWSASPCVAQVVFELVAAFYVSISRVGRWTLTPTPAKWSKMKARLNVIPFPKFGYKLLHLNIYVYWNLAVQSSDHLLWRLFKKTNSMNCFLCSLTQIGSTLEWPFCFVFLVRVCLRNSGWPGTH